MLSEQDVRGALKDTIKSDQVDSWSTDFNFRKAGALDSLDHLTFILHLAEDHGLAVRDDEITALVTIQAVLDFAARKEAQ